MIDVLIAAYGEDALEKIGSLPHAPYPGVRYVVSWQNYDRTRIPESIESREDFLIHFEDSTGLCNNRNALISLAQGEIAVVSDDDLIYEASHFENIINAFAGNPDRHFLTFRYSSELYPKSYPKESFPLSKPPKGYFVTSMELAFNLKKIKEDFGSYADLHFNPFFGVNGSAFGSGEEDILISSLLKKGYSAKFIPRDICVNTDSTTSERIGASREFIETKGAVMLLIKPSSWFLRMLSHAYRADRSKGENRVPFFKYCGWWLAGVRKARKIKVFR